VFPVAGFARYAEVNNTVKVTHRDGNVLHPL
jgi:hypothetical protein